MGSKSRRDWQNTNGKLKERIRSYRQISETGKQKAKGAEIVHFDIDRGEAYLDADKSRSGMGASSFKQSLLRFVQTTIQRFVFKKIREAEKKTAEKMLVELPPNTCERLDYLKSEGIIGNQFLQQDMEILKDNYLFFLWLYHKSEHEAYLRNNRTITFNPELARERIKDTIELSQKLSSGN